MWISKRKWEQLEKRVTDLEEKQSQSPVKPLTDDEFEKILTESMKKFQERPYRLKF